jgi:hypothetical protein
LNQIESNGASATPEDPNPSVFVFCQYLTGHTRRPEPVSYRGIKHIEALYMICEVEEIENVRRHGKWMLFGP